VFPGGRPLAGCSAARRAFGSGILDIFIAPDFASSLAMSVVPASIRSMASLGVNSPLTGFVVYTTLLHLVMLALPRYIFPIMPVMWIFAACLLLWRADGVPHRVDG
jgi:hypothetical protein